MTNFKKAVPPSAEDEEVKDEVVDDESEDVEDESQADGEVDESEEESDEESDESEEKVEKSEEKEEEKPVKAKKGKKKVVAEPLDAEDAAKGLPEKPSVVSPVEKIGDLLEDRRFALREKALHVREHLAAQPLVNVFIPRSENESKDAVQYYNINGFAFYVRKGVYQQVPQDIMQMISDTYGQDARLVAEHPFNLNNNAAAAKEFSR